MSDPPASLVDVAALEPVLTPLLARLLGAPVEVQELKHKPGRRRTVRVTGARSSSIVKIYASNRAAVVADRIAALATGPPEPVVPLVLACMPELRLVALTEVPGVPLRTAAAAADLTACRRAGAALGRWHRAWRDRLLQDRAPSALRPHSAAREVEILAARARSAPAEVAGAVTAALADLTAAPAAGEWAPATVVHRDLYEEQVVIGEHVGLIDLDDAALGPAELDVGNLLAHLVLLELRGTGPLAPVVDALLAGYADEGPDLDPALLQRCRALSLLRLACIHDRLDLVRAADAEATTECARVRHA